MAVRVRVTRRLADGHGWAFVVIAEVKGEYFLIGTCFSPLWQSGDLIKQIT